LSERLLDAKAQPEVAQRRGSVAVVDGHNGLGYETARVSMGLACDLAAATGVGVVTARGSNHFGMAAHWALQAVDAGMVGFATTNGPPVMAHWGSKQAVMSNNPFSWGIPAAREFPVILDASCSESARGKVRLAAARGERIPPGWALGPDGTPTTDPRAALDGALSPFGGAKGSGIAIVNEILSAGLSEAHTLTQVTGLSMSTSKLHGSWGIGHFFFALDPSAFGPADAFRDRVDSAIGTLRTASPACSDKAIRLPGERAFVSERHARRSGVPLIATTERSLSRFANDINISPTWT
jgi:LDH2 family malate/lactate/ureidoglycolate dehydrogenase